MNPNESRKLARIAGLCSLVLLVFGIAPVVFGLPISLTRAPLLALFIVTNLVGGIGLLIASIVWNLDGLRTLVTARSSRMASNAAVYSAAVVGILVLVNVLATRHSHKWDLTESKLFTLAPQSQKVLDGLANEVVLRAFWRKPEQDQVKDLLANYERASKKVKVLFVDPVEDPAAAKQFEITQERTLHIQSGTDQVRITEPTEEKITNGIIKVSGGEAKTIYVLKGHGEPELEDVAAPHGYGYLKKALEDEHYKVQDLLLMTKGEVPADASLVIAAPTRPLLDVEIQALERYLDRGGRLFALLEPKWDESSHQIVHTGLEEMLKKRGINVNDNLVLDVELQLFAGPKIGAAPGAESYGTHPITENMKEVTFYGDFVREVRPNPDTPGATLTTLVRTSANSWAESDVAGVFERGAAGRDAADLTGPISIATAYERKTPAEAKKDAADGASDPADAAKAGAEGAAKSAKSDGDKSGEDSADSKSKDILTRIVAFGDADWVDNGQITRFAPNQDLALNAVGWLVDRGDLISIRPKKSKVAQLALTPAQTQAIFVASVFLLPELLLLAGLAVWQSRKWTV
ncbi:MAG: Gldg family protein [bacterium]